MCGIVSRVSQRILILRLVKRVCGHLCATSLVLSMHLFSQSLSIELRCGGQLLNVTFSISVKAASASLCFSDSAARLCPDRVSCPAYPCSYVERPSIHCMCLAPEHWMGFRDQSTVGSFQELEALGFSFQFS